VAAGSRCVPQWLAQGNFFGRDVQGVGDVVSAQSIFDVLRTYLGGLLDTIKVNARPWML
jgi:hypothetical protein